MLVPLSRLVRVTHLLGKFCGGMSQIGLDWIGLDWMGWAWPGAGLLLTSVQNDRALLFFEATVCHKTDSLNDTIEFTRTGKVYCE